MMPKEYWLGSGVALQTPIPLYLIDQQRCFLIPGTVVFEMDDAKRILVGFWGGAPNLHTSAHPTPAKVFLDTWDGGF